MILVKLNFEILNSNIKIFYNKFRNFEFTTNKR